MNLENQRVTGNNQVTINDSLNAALIELNLSLTESSVAPSSNDLYIYVDKQPKDNPSEERRQYLFELNDILRFNGETSDVFIQHLVVENNDICLKSNVERNISLDAETQESYILEETTLEDVDGFPIILFEGENYIYTNYDNIDIDLIYVKDALENKVFLNGSMYHQHKLRNDGEFCLDDIYFKDAFTKTGDDLNIEINNCCVESISSKNNKFSLDEQGNLVVNTISCNNVISNGSEVNELTSDDIYPVGSVYVSSTSSNPSGLFGGEWELIDKEFAPHNASGGFTINTTNVTSAAANWTRSGHTITVTAALVNKVKLAADYLVLGTWDFATIGLTSLGLNIRTVGWTHEGGCVSCFTFQTNGNMCHYLTLPDNYISIGRTVYYTFTITIGNINHMLDSACNKFYWKRTA